MKYRPVWAISQVRDNRRPAATNRGLAFSLPWLMSSERKDREGGGLLILKAAKLGYSGDELVNGKRAYGAAARADLVTPGEYFVRNDDCSSPIVKHLDVACDWLEALVPQQCNKQVLLTTFECSAVGNEAS